MTKHDNVEISAVFNFVLADYAIVGIVLVLISIGRGLFLSTNSPDKVLTGVLRVTILFLLLCCACGICVVAGASLLMNLAWEYVLHLVATVITALSCIGSIYTIVAITFSLRPEFKSLCPD